MTRRATAFLTVAALACACDRPPPAPTPLAEQAAVPAPQPAQADLGGAEPNPPEPRPSTRKFLDGPVREPACHAGDVMQQGVKRVPDNLHPTFDPQHESVIARETAQDSGSQRVWLNGVARVRYRVRQDLHATLLVRAAPDGRSGVGIRVEGTSAHWVRMQDGSVTPLEAEQPIYRFERLAELEIVATVLGSDLIGQVHDASNGLELMSLQAQDPSPTPGRVRVHLAEGNPDATRIELLSEREACQRPPTPPGDGVEPVFRYFEGSEAEVAALPTGDRELLRPIEDRGPASAYETTTFGLERAFCGGLELHDVAVEPPFKFVDEDYATYRVHPPVRAERGFRTDLSVHGPLMVEELLAAYHAEFPELTRLVELGKSREGRSIWALAIGREPKDGDPRPSILLNGGHHGDEPMATSFVLDAIQTLLSSAGRDEEVDRWLQQFVIWTVPLVNPDGGHRFLEVSRYTGRKNGWDVDRDGVLAKREGVDLNRNYPFRWASLGDDPLLTSPHGKWYRGAKPASEPEVQAMMKLADSERFVASISYHTGTVCVLAPYTVEGVENPEPNEAWAIAEDMTAAMGRALDGRRYRVRDKIYPVEGTDQDWLRHAHGTVAFLVEGVSRTPDDYCGRAKATEPNRIAWQTLLRRASSGPAIYGTVRGGAGATVRIAEQKLPNSERWQVRPRDGAFAHLLPATGRYTVVVERDGRSTERTVEVSGPTVLQLTAP